MPISLRATVKERKTILSYLPTSVEKIWKHTTHSGGAAALGEACKIGVAQLSKTHKLAKVPGREAA